MDVCTSIMKEFSNLMNTKYMKKLALITAITAFSIALYQGHLTHKTILYGFIAGLLAISVREIAQQTIAQWMTAYIDVEISETGASLTVLTGIISYLTQLPFILILPLYNEYEMKAHEKWGITGYSIWPKSEYWFAGVNILALTLLSGLLLMINQTIAHLTLIFTLSQLLPLKKTLIEGETDGAKILYWSGFAYLIFLGTNIIFLALTL